MYSIQRILVYHSYLMHLWYMRYPKQKWMEQVKKWKRGKIKQPPNNKNYLSIEIDIVKSMKKWEEESKWDTERKANMKAVNADYGHTIW